MQLVCFGDVSTDMFATIRRSIGPLKPLVDLTLDRAHKAIVEFKKVVAEKSRLESEENDARAAKRFRDAAAAGCCLICMDDNPNIATLCCGKAAHISCLATWLSQKLECPHCRTTLPQRERILQQAPAPQADQALTAAGVTEEDSTEDTTTTTRIGHNQDTTTEDTTTTYGGRNGNHDTTEDTTTEDTTTTYSGRNGNHDTTEDTTEDTTTTTSCSDNNQDTTEDTTTTSDDSQTNTSVGDSTSVAAGRTSPQRCVYSRCRNLAAQSCDNRACGSCCQMYGQFSCGRHNV